MQNGIWSSSAFASSSIHLNLPMQDGSCQIIVNHYNLPENPGIRNSPCIMYWNKIPFCSSTPAWIDDKINKTTNPSILQFAALEWLETKWLMTYSIAKSFPWFNPSLHLSDQKPANNSHINQKSPNKQKNSQPHFISFSLGVCCFCPILPIHHPFGVPGRPEPPPFGGAVGVFWKC